MRLFGERYAPAAADWLVTLFLVAITVFILAGLAGFIGCAGCNEGHALDARELAVYAELEACTGLHADPPTLKAVAARPCPTSKRNCCAADVADFSCPDGSGKLCGAAAIYDPECESIFLPRGDPEVCNSESNMRFEMVRSLLCQAGHPDCRAESGLSDPSWKCV